MSHFFHQPKKTQTATSAHFSLPVDSHVYVLLPSDSSQDSFLYRFVNYTVRNVEFIAWVQWAGCEQRALGDASVAEEVQEAADPEARVSIREILLQIGL